MISYGATYGETLRAIGGRAKQLRLTRNFRQAEVAKRAGVGVATLHRFENTGHASFENVLRIATALQAETAFDKLFEQPVYASIDEALARPKVRQRAPRRK